MTRHYVTTAHGPLLPQLRALFASMQRHCRPFVLHVLTEGREVFDWALEQYPEIAPAAAEAFVRRHPRLTREALPGPPRTPREVAITQRWTFAAELLGCCCDAVTVIDADLWFFSSPEPVFEEIGAATMAVLPHGFAPAALGARGVTMESHRQYGLYNAGFTYFSDFAPAARFAELVRQGPIAFRDHPDENGVVIGEQGYLETLATALGAHVIQNPAAAPGPWCAHAQSLTRDEDGRLLFGGRPLVAWHYHSLRPGVQLADANYEVSAEQAALLYEPYLAALRAEGAP